MTRSRKPPPQAPGPEPLRLYVSELRPGDVILDVDGENLTVASKPVTVVGGKRVTMDVRSRIGVVSRAWGAHEKVMVRRV